MGRKFGWDRNLQITRYILVGEKTRGGIIINPRKKLTKRQLIKTRYP